MAYGYGCDLVDAAQLEAISVQLIIANKYAQLSLRRGLW